jgi:hypothetical protein
MMMRSVRIDSSVVVVVVRAVVVVVASSFAPRAMATHGAADDGGHAND